MNATATHVKMVEHVLAWLMDTPVPVGLVTVGMTVKTVKTIIITARGRSLGQGNVFTGVCLSTGGLASQHAPQVT